MLDSWPDQQESFLFTRTLDAPWGRDAYAVFGIESSLFILGPALDMIERHLVSAGLFEFLACTFENHHSYTRLIDTPYARWAGHVFKYLLSKNRLLADVSSSPLRARGPADASILSKWQAVIYEISLETSDLTGGVPLGMEVKLAGAELRLFGLEEYIIGRPDEGEDNFHVAFKCAVESFAKRDYFQRSVGATEWEASEAQGGLQAASSGPSQEKEAGRASNHGQ